MKNTLIVLLGLIILLCLLCGCVNPTPVRTPRTQSISQSIDDKVKAELPKALSSIIGQNVIDYGPYAIAVLFSILYGKKHVDFNKLKSKKV